jgi:hypothetical protein
VFSQLVVPGILILAGLVAHMYLESSILNRRATTPVSLQAVFTWVSIELVVRMVILTVSVFVAAKLFDIGFGALGPTILKVGAIALLASLPSTIVTYMMPRGGGFGVFSLGGLMNYMAAIVLFKALFDLDTEDANCCAITVAVMNFVAGFALVAVVFSMLR